MSNEEVLYPEVEVNLVGQDGNAMFIIGRVQRQLKRAGLRAQASKFTHDAVNSESYEDLLALVLRTVTVV